MTAFPWFRLYSEILSERKIERIRRMTGLSRVVIRGAWVTLLAMANDSPQRGCLMWTDDLWITEQELCDDLEMDPADFDKLLAAFKTMHMISEQSNGLSCTNFGKRQFKSDNSTARVKAFRGRQKAAQPQQETPTSNVSETFQCNAPEIETELESDSEAEKETDPAHTDPPPKQVKPITPAMAHYESLYGLFECSADLDALLAAEKEVGPLRVKAAISWAHNKSPPIQNMGAICTAARNWTQSTGPPGNGPDTSSDATVRAIEQLEAKQNANITG